MKGFAIISVVLLQLCVCYGHPAAQDGVGAFAYQDSIGNRYGGSYGLRDGQVVDVRGDYPPPSFVDPPQWGNVPTIPDIDNFFPEYFRNFEYLIQHIGTRRPFGFPRPHIRRFKKRAFDKDFRSRNLALNAARKAYDITNNKANTHTHTHTPSVKFRFPAYPTFTNRNAGGFDMSQNSAYAGAAAGPGFSHHVAAINPENPQTPNVEVTKTYSKPNSGGYYSVSSSSYSSSSNVNGEMQNHRGAETKVNNNGVVTQYKVQN